MPTTTRWFPRALALAAALPLAGCTAARKPLRVTHVVTIVFDDRGCPVDLRVPTGEQCDGLPPKDAAKCLLVEPKAKVEFLLGGDKAPDDLEFSLAFSTANPFDRESTGVKLKKGQRHPADVRAGAPLGTYVYQVTNPRCPVVDPQIIIRD